MPFLAPDRDTVFQNFLALLPRGRAWQSSELIVDAGDSVMRQFWYALSNTWQALEQKIVDLLLEFSCETAVDDLDGWLTDYEDDCGLADFNLCLKVHEDGQGQNLAFYQSIAVALGYVATFEWLNGDHTAYPGVYSTLLVTVDGTSSPIFGLVPVGEVVVGEFRFGGIGTSLLNCVLQRVVPAHIAVQYIVT